MSQQAKPQISLYACIGGHPMSVYEVITMSLSVDSVGDATGFWGFKTSLATH